MEKLIGRETEKELLHKALKSQESSLIAVYGRRRVGKTFLIKSVCRSHLLFEFSGVHDAGLRVQLQNFSLSLQKAMKNRLPLEPPSNWVLAFHYLQKFLEPQLKKNKGVVFFDEFPWINTPKSGFLQAFEHFWNTWATGQKNLVVVICGSAAAWMIKKIVHNKGGLHNRITQKIRLLPFDLYETESYLKSRRVKLDRYQLLQIYMAMGGVPQYLKLIEPGQSAAQAIDRLCFTKDGFLKEEFKNLYHSLFTNAGSHISVIKALAKKGKGLTRNEIIDACRLTSGGTTTTLLEELEQSGFIKNYSPFDKNIKDSIFKLSDEYSLFYLRFIEQSRSTGRGTWLRLTNLPSYVSWSGYAFESVCQKHIEPVKKSLGIEGVHTENSAWRYIAKKHEKGAQADLLLNRQDMCINLCEMKFSRSEFVITKTYAAELENKMKVFSEQSKTKKTIFLTMITTFGVKKNEHFIRLVQSEITIDHLFINS